MRKISFPAVVIVVLAAALHGQSVAVTEPYAGQTWDVNSTHLVKWTTSGAPPGTMVDIYLLKNGAWARDIARNIADSGSFPWTIPADAPAGTAQVQAVLLGLSVSGNSDLFTIGRQAVEFQIASPTGNETWCLGIKKEIRWSGGTGQVEKVDIELHWGTSMRSIAAATPNDGLYEWTVPLDLAEGAYRIRVSARGASGSSESPLFKIKGCFQAQDHDKKIPPKANERLVANQSNLTQFTPLPDLVVCENWDASCPHVGEAKAIHVTVKNVGLGKAAASVCILTVDGHGDRIIQVQALGPGESANFSYAYKWQTRGWKYILAKVDDAGLITESNEKNNVLMAPVQVIGQDERCKMSEVKACSNALGQK